MPSVRSKSAETWDSFAKHLESQVFSHTKNASLARDEAEKARVRAETDRNIAQEARDQAYAQVISERAAREAATESLQDALAERSAIAESLSAANNTNVKLQQELTALRTELQREKDAFLAADADRRQQRRDLDDLTKELNATRKQLTTQTHLAEDNGHKLDAALSDIRDLKEELRQVSSRAGEAENRAHALAEEARRSVAALRTGVKLQEGLRAKAEIGLNEATKELSAVQDAASAVSVERQLLKDRLGALQQETASLSAENERLNKALASAQVDGNKKAAAGLTQDKAALQTEVTNLRHRVVSLEKELQDARNSLAQLDAEAEADRNEKELMQIALQEAKMSTQKLRHSWHAAEDALHEMVRAKSEAESGRHRLTEALVKERAARIMAQQELERLAEAQAGIDGSASLGDSLTEVDKARLALWHEEMVTEHKSLELILEALKEMKAVAHGEGVQGPMTPEMSPEKV